METSHCGCGYSFSEGEFSFSKLSDEMLAEEEALYEEYLAARAEQAGKEATEAKKITNNTDPLNHNHIKVDEKELNAKIAQAQLKSQTDRVAKANKKAAEAKARRKQKTLAEVKKKAERAKIRAKIKAEAKAQAKAQAMDQARKKVDAAIKAGAKAKAKTQADSARHALEAARKIKDKLHEKASALFRAKQARKAGQLMQKKRVRKVELKPITKKEITITKPPATTVQHKTTEPGAFRATQAARAEKIKNTIECPNCTAQLSKKAKGCKCGYTFESGASLMPSLSLDTSDAHDTKATITDVKITTRRVGD
ncbi:MAG: hypothetical protein BMS9Abin11_1853 [Gammaproteobacteria bacterium]|nr:MAG: hypothetical protein BMS9Abin11_1853 [Gammaproteobacteria bacterium]